MYTGLLHSHSGLRYLVITVLGFVALKAIVSMLTNSKFKPIDKTLALITLILTHIQFTIGLILLFVSAKFQWFKDYSATEIMADSQIRFWSVEHPLLMILAVVGVTIGYSKMKRVEDSRAKFRFLAMFFTIAFAFIMLGLPWSRF
jgi:hypothetical protein